MKTSSKALIFILIIVIAFLLARYVIFKDKFEEWGQGLERVGAWQENYKKEHPNATKAEMDAAFKSGIADLQAWKDEYKKDHPGATDSDADAAFNTAWNKN